MGETNSKDQALAEDPPAEDPPADEPPADEPPAEDAPAEDEPAEDAPAEDDHALCFVGKGELPSKFPLKTFVKNEAKCKPNKAKKMRVCSFKYNSDDLKKGRLGSKTTWNNSYILYVIMAAILVVGLGLFAFYNFKIRKGHLGRAGGGGKASNKGRSLKTKSKRSPGNKKATSTMSGGKKSSKVSSKKSGKSSMKASSKKSSSKK